MSGKYGEPWEVESAVDAQIEEADVIDTDGNIVALVEFDRAEDSDAIARRICLAVNACASLSDESLEADVIGTARRVLEAVKQCCLFPDDSGNIGVTQDPHIEGELFGEICEALALLTESGR